MGVFQADRRGAEIGVRDSFLRGGNSMNKARAWPPRGVGFKGWSMAGVLGLLLDEPLRSTLNSGSIFIFLSRELNAVPLCPVDKEVIKSQEVFKDNCCKREVLNLYVYCKNAPGCNAKIILGRYQVGIMNKILPLPFFPVLCIEHLFVTVTKLSVGEGRLSEISCLETLQRSMLRAKV